LHRWLNDLLSTKLDVVGISADVVSLDKGVTALTKIRHAVDSPLLLAERCQGGLYTFLQLKGSTALNFSSS
jgi:hypothetical protein